MEKAEYGMRNVVLYTEYTEDTDSFIRVLRVQQQMNLLHNIHSVAAGGGKELAEAV